MIMDAARMRRVGRCGASGAMLAVMAACDHAASTLAQDGSPGTSITQLGWFLLITAGVVVLIIAVLVPFAALKRHDAPATLAANGADVQAVDRPREAGENRWLTTFAILIPAVILTVSFGFTVETIDAVGYPAHRTPASTIIVTGHQWWWEVSYGDSTGQGFITANEIHIPVGQPVRVKLQTADVIHSFWVPQLTGKMDVIPGQNNETWIEARRAGTFDGPCGEFCGAQHAHMRLRVIAETPEQYASWYAAQQHPAPAPIDSASDVRMGQGFRTFTTAGCATCHTIRGTSAGGGVGPDLTHVGSRQMLAAGAVPNTAGGLEAWIADPQGIKPGSDMPRMAVPPQDMPALVAYLESLK